MANPISVRLVGDTQRAYAKRLIDGADNGYVMKLGAETRFLPALEGEGMFPVGMKSSTLTVAQFSGLIELIYAFGAKHDVRWSEPIRDAA